MKALMTVCGILVAPLVLCAQGITPTEAPRAGSAFDTRLKEEAAVIETGRALTAHRPTYVLPVTYSSNPNNEPAREAGQEDSDLDNVEVKFQFSLKALAWDDVFEDNGKLYVGYTQQSLWQAYDSDNSSPFRDTNYEPELFLTFDTDFEVLGMRHRLLTFGAVHQSNGRGLDALSRSWNRIYASFLLERGNFVVALKPWYRIPEDEEDDDNQNIENYIGYGDLKVAYKMGEMEFATIIRNNLKPDDNRGSGQFDWTFPLVKEIRGYVQYFNGYCETLVDFDHADQRIGVGVLLGDWL